MGKVMFFIAHDDDVILSSAGLIQRLIADGNEVSVVLFANGETSHQVVLDIKKNPTPAEVAQKRRIEFLKAMELLGISIGNITFFDFPTRKVVENKPTGVDAVMCIIQKEKPQEIYFNYPDCHIDHRAVSDIVWEAFLRTPDYQKPVVKRFVIWTDELSAGRNDVDIVLAPEIPSKAEIFSLTEHELAVKRKAIFEVHSQVETWPYPEWQPQEKPILDANFLKYFLRGEEIFVPV